MRRPTGARTKRSPRGTSFRVEILESRQLLNSDLLQATSMASAGGEARPFAIAVPVAIGRASTPIGSGGSPIAPSGGGTPAAGPYTPAQIRHAYGIDQLSEDGTGQTIAIVDAYDDPSIANDLAAFDARYNLPAASFTKATPQGLPAADANWSLEMSLDVEWAHVVAPGAKILLVEAASATDADLLNAVSDAVSQGANQVSMSWGGGEFTGESSYDSYFNQPGVTFLASTGDTAGSLEFPAVSPYVTAVGGTSISLDSAGDKLSESAWSSGGGGLSTQNPQPSYQAGFLNSTSRGVPDVSYDANPGSGVIVDDNGTWYGVGGTSAGAPQWAGLIALANQGRAALGRPSVGTSQAFGTNSTLYQLAGGTGYTNPNGDFQDIATGSLATTPPIAATPGYDLATGLGSPVSNKLIPDLIGPAPAPPAPVPTISDPGFESSVMPPAGYVVHPAGSSWTFAGVSGVSGPGTAFSAANPATPQGRQIGFFEDSGSISQAVSNWAAGTYKVTFEAARWAYAPTGPEPLQVLVDGVSVGSFSLTQASWTGETTASFSVAAGAHTVKLQGIHTTGGWRDAALIDQVAIVAAGNSPSIASPPVAAIAKPSVDIPAFPTDADGLDGAPAVSTRHKPARA